MLDRGGRSPSKTTHSRLPMRLSIALTDVRRETRKEPCEDAYPSCSYRIALLKIAFTVGFSVSLKKQVLRCECNVADKTSK